MLLTVSLFAVFFLGSILALGIGLFSDRFEVLFFGLIVLFLLGLWTLQSGISYDSGEVISVVGNQTVVSDTFSTTSGTWSSAFGLLLLLVSAGLLLTYDVGRRRDKEKRLRSIDFDED